MLQAMPVIESVNVGVPRAIRPGRGTSGIDKAPVEHSVAVAAPGPKGIGGGGLAGDVIGDLVHHGGNDQAVYSYAREDLDWWQGEIGEALRSGTFGENLTTLGVEVTDARIGERWRIGEELVLQVTAPRIPCANFAIWMHRQGWMKTFTRRAHPGAYLRVLEPGEVRKGDPLVVLDRPDHEVTIGVVFRALTLERELLPTLLAAADYLERGTVRRAEEYARNEGAGR